MLPASVEQEDQCQAAGLREGLKAEAKDNKTAYAGNRIPVLKVYKVTDNVTFFHINRIQTALTEYYKIGKFVAVHGLKGELVLQHNLGKKSTLKGLQAIFIEERKDSFIPWFIGEARIKNDEETILKLDTIDTREAAKKLTQKEIWVPETDFKKFAAKSAPGSMLGYNVINEKESLGPILEVIEQPHQLLCRLEIDGKEVLIPVHESTLKKINHNKKEVIVSLPEGLLDIYLG